MVSGAVAGAGRKDQRSSRDFDLSLDNFWYGKVVLLYKMTVLTDDDEMQGINANNLTTKFSK
jgi:hypothetical protein